MPDFELIVVGGLIDLPLVERLASTRPWIHVTGPRAGATRWN